MKKIIALISLILILNAYPVTTKAEYLYAVDSEEMHSLILVGSVASVIMGSMVLFNPKSSNVESFCGLVTAGIGVVGINFVVLRW